MAIQNFTLWDNEGNFYDTEVDLPDGYGWYDGQAIANRFQVAAVEFEDDWGSSSSRPLRLIDLPTGRVLASASLNSSQFLVNAFDADTRFQIGEISNRNLVLKSYDYALATTAINLARPVGTTVTIAPPVGVSWSSNASFEYAGTLGAGGYLLVHDWSSTGRDAALYRLTTGTTPQATSIALPSGSHDWIGSPFVSGGKLWLQTSSNGWADNWSQTLYRLDGSSWTESDEDAFWLAWDSTVGYQSVIRDGQSAIDLSALRWGDAQPDYFTIDEVNPVRLPSGGLLVRVGAHFSAEAALDVGFERWLVIKDGQVVADKAFNKALGLRSVQTNDEDYVYFQQIDARFTGGAGHVTAVKQNAGGVTLYKIALDKVAGVLANASDASPLATLAGAPDVIQIGRYTLDQLPGNGAVDGKVELIKGYMPANLLVAGGKGGLIWSVLYDAQADTGVQYVNRTEANGNITWSKKLPGDIRDVLIDGASCFVLTEADNALDPGARYSELDFATGALLSARYVTDIVDGSSANDSLSSHYGGELILGREGNDRIDGSNGDDRLLGGAGADRLSGGAGNDRLTGGLGDDVLDGGSGDFDWVTYTGAAAAVQVNLGLAQNQARGGDGTDQITGVEHVQGSRFNDTLTGNAGDNLLEGWRGNDTLDGGAGLDWAGYGSASGAVTVNLALTSNQATGADGTDQLIRIENVRGSDYNDRLTGNAGNNFLQGGRGSDTLTGGMGKDTFVFAASDSGQAGGFDKITDYAKGAVGTGDLIDYSANLTQGGLATTATANRASIHASTGVATFAAGSGTTLADALADVANSLKLDGANGAARDLAGEFAFFKVNGRGDYHLFISDGVAGVTANDVVVKLVGVTGIGGIDLTGGNLALTS